MLASDVNNPDFTGPKDPDSGLYVDFHWHEPVDAWKSNEESQRLQKRVVVKGPKAAYVRIMVPGDKQSEWIQAVTEAHKQRFPKQWLAWQISEGLVGGEEDIPGWKLSEWEEVGQDLLHELTYLRFQTVEQLAGASDKQIQGIGIGGLNLREKARVALRNRMGSETRAALEADRAEKDELKRELAEMKEQMAQLLAVQEKRGPGRPPKEAP